ncbi:hypothetical protein [Dietzia sp.]|uniref:hypothetical protein n=1 Tax=Dietzia sp. TaxID=1871616 RepID=UPI002FDAA144
MRTVPGVVHRYSPNVTDVPGARLRPASFDQERHIALGPRAGSWMALAFRLPFPIGRADIAAAWLAAIARHGTLRTRVAAPGGPGSCAHDVKRPLLQDISVTPGWWRTPDATPGEDPRAVLRREFDEACQPFAVPSYALCLLEPSDPRERPQVVIGFDHSHVDAWSLLVVLRDLTAALDAVADGREPFAGQPAPPPFAAHTAELAARPVAPEAVRERWNEIMRTGGGEMPRFPLPLGDVSAPRDEVVEVRDVLDAAGLARLEENAGRRGARMLGVAVAEMTAAFRALAGPPKSGGAADVSPAPALRAVFPVHSRHGERWNDSVGWFITNSVLENDATEPAACGAAIKAAIALGSHPLARLLAPWGGMPHTPEMFAISWLDNRRLPVDVDHTLDPQHVSAAIRTTGVMVWFVVNPGGLHIRCRYPDTPEARASVGLWLDLLCAGLAVGADSPIGA